MVEVTSLNERQRLAAWCDRWLDAWSGNRPERLLNFYADDCIVVDPLLPQPVVGRTALAEALVELLAHYPSWRFARVRCKRMPSGGVAIDWIMHLPEDSPASGTPGSSQLLLRDELIVQQECWFDHLPRSPVPMKTSRSGGGRRGSAEARRRA